MDYTCPQSSLFSAPIGSPLETTKAGETPPSSANDLKTLPPSLPTQGHLENTPGLFPASPPASPRPAVIRFCDSTTPPVAAPQKIPWRANFAFIRSNATLVDRGSPSNHYSPSDIEAAEILLMLYHGRPTPPPDPDATDSEDELAAKRLMDLHAADKELGFATKSQPGCVRRERRRTRIEPAVVTEPVRTRSGREVKKCNRLGA